MYTGFDKELDNSTMNPVITPTIPGMYFIQHDSNKCRIKSKCNLMKKANLIFIGEEWDIYGE